MQVMPSKLVLSQAPDRLKIATNEHEFRHIWALRAAEFGRLYPALKGVDFTHDTHDGCACVLYSENKAGEIISTGRVVFDSGLGLPADQIIKSEVDKLRQRGLVIAEPSKFAIAKEARGVLAVYLRTYYEIAVGYHIDSLVFIMPAKNTGFYEKIMHATVLTDDVGYSYGTNARFALVEWHIKTSKAPFSAWLGEELP